jgi:hypothetical protein
MASGVFSDAGGFLMDTSFADAVCQLEDEVSAACHRASSALSDKEISTELRRIADELEGQSGNERT